MSAQTQVYYYKQRQSVVLLERGADATRRYQTVYAKELTISKGVDNILEFAFINQNQKPVNIDGKDITARILNYNGTETLLQKTLTPILPLTGITSLQLSAEDIADIDVQKCYYSLEIPVDSFNYPVFVDANGGARGVLNVVNSVLPSFVPAQQVTIPSHPWPAQGNGNGVFYTSSIINTKEQSLFTVQTYYANFTGNTQFQGSILDDFSLPYDITTVEAYSGYESTISNINVVGPNTWITQGITDANIIFVGANVTSISANANLTITAIGVGNGNIELNNSTGVANDTNLIFTTHGYTGTIGTTIVGYHPFVRLAINNFGTEGTLPPNANVGNSTYLGGDVVDMYFR